MQFLICAFIVYNIYRYIEYNMYSYVLDILHFKDSMCIYFKFNSFFDMQFLAINIITLRFVVHISFCSLSLHDACLNVQINQPLVFVFQDIFVGIGQPYNQTIASDIRM